MVLFGRGGVRGFIGGGAWFYSGGCAWFYSGGVCVVLFGGGHAWFYLGGACMVLFGGACMVLFGGVCVVLFRGGVRGFFSFFGYNEIRSMSGRYASYWNVFLFSLSMNVDLSNTIKQIIEAKQNRHRRNQCDDSKIAENRLR